jgi:hypothetical protein
MRTKIGASFCLSGVTMGVSSPKRIYYYYYWRNTQPVYVNVTHTEAVSGGMTAKGRTAFSL